MAVENIAPPNANIALFVRLSPNISKMARVTRMSRQTIYDILNQKSQARPGTVKSFNNYLNVLFAQRMKISRTVT